MSSVSINAASGPAIAADAGSRDSGVTEYVQSIRQTNDLIKTYAASVIAAAGVAGIFLLLGGSSTATVRLRRVLVSGVAGTGAFFDLSVVKYTTAATGGTAGTAPTIAQMDSATPSSSAASATVALYTAAPTAGTNAGIVAARKLLLSASGTLTYISPPVEIPFGAEGEQCPTLRGTTQQLGLVLSAAPATGSIDATLWWTEELTAASF